MSFCFIFKHKKTQSRNSINVQQILYFVWKILLTSNIIFKKSFSDQMKYLPFAAFIFCFGNSRKVDISLALSETLLDDISGKRISLSSSFVWLIVSSGLKKTAF